MSDLLELAALETMVMYVLEAEYGGETTIHPPRDTSAMYRGLDAHSDRHITVTHTANGVTVSAAASYCPHLYGDLPNAAERIADWIGITLEKEHRREGAVTEDETEDENIGEVA